MLIKLCNLGQDAVLRYTPQQQPVLNLSLAYDVGYGDNSRTQWIEGALWGSRAERLAPALTKGTRLLIYADDIEIESYTRQDRSTGVKLKCRLVDIKFTGSRPEPAGPKVINNPPPPKEDALPPGVTPSPYAQNPTPSNPDDDGIPF